MLLPMGVQLASIYKGEQEAHPIYNGWPGFLPH